MKTSSPETPKTPSPPSILLIGPPGGGKTTLALQFPGVAIMDCDGNLDGPERFLRKERLKSLAYKYESFRQYDNGKPIAVEDAFPLLVESVKACYSNPTIKTVVIDSLTHVNEFIIRNVLAKQNKTKNPLEMEMRDWIPFKSKAYQLLVGALQGCGKTTICTCHEKILTETAGIDFKERVIGYSPAFQGGVTDYFGAFFTDMWRCEARQGLGGEQEFWVTPTKTPKSDLKNSLLFDGPINVTKSAQTILERIKV